MQLVKKQTGFDVKGALQEDSCPQDTILERDVIYYLRKMKTEFSTLVNSLIEQKGDKLVIFIDDLDRIKPVKALEFLEAIKNFLDVENCVFVMAVDYSVIQSGMAEKMGRSAQELQGKSYFDKIIQVPFNMPVSSYRTDRYIMSLLGWDYDSGGKKYEKQKRDTFFLKVRDSGLSSADVDFFSNITGLTVGNNPRGIKRAVNYANLLKMIVEMKRKGTGKKWTLADAKLLYPLTCMQLAWPELFANFAEHPSPGTLHLYEDFDYLANLEGMDQLFKRVHNKEEVKSNITGFFDEFIALCDVDGNGEISTQEFKPIWEMMSDANLTSTKMADLEEDWKKLKIKVLANLKSKDLSFIDNILNMFRASDSFWNDPLQLTLLEAGKKFYNILWAGKQVGSLVTTQKDPILLYLKADAEAIIKNLPEGAGTVVTDVKHVGHYGTGDSRVDLPALAQMSDGVQIMNAIHKTIAAA